MWQCYMLLKLQIFIEVNMELYFFLKEDID